ncbi:Alkyltransferase-like protein 1 [Escovopsis weberi]|uniref:Alkyltransferase-like protein 1 n=1 Tax=Escovopsis weberi TaxID=150374 RepID=A0A0M8N9P7_ESCWE|nr:Alkyltransferase-like protein 1 [Escovopsis weberi]
MPRSDEAQAFFHAVYQAVQQVPTGRVTTYGHIAALIGTRICLKHLPTDPSAPYNNTNIPWQRIINSKGGISPRSQPSASQNQAEALRAEGVEVTQGALGEYFVSLDVYGWFPQALPQDL